MTVDIIGTLVTVYVHGVAKATISQGSWSFDPGIEIWKEKICNVDIARAPLRDTPFNKSRSQIKLQEVAAAKLPLVASDIGLYTDIEHGKNGYLVKTADDWFNALEELVLNPQKRKAMGEEAYRFVAENRTIQKNWTKYRDMILDMTKNSNS